MAARDEGVKYDQLHHLIARACGYCAAGEGVARGGRQQVGEDGAWLIVDNALPKKGRRSVGIAPQYASSLGKDANCQMLASLTLAAGEVPVTA